MDSLCFSCSGSDKRGGSVRSVIFRGNRKSLPASHDLSLEFVAQSETHKVGARGDVVDGPEHA
jgi:hypothetical protein